MKYRQLICVLSVLVSFSSCHTEVDVYGNIEGVVQEYGTQTPLENCLVELISSKSVTKTKTNESGVFSFSHEEMGDKKLVVSKNGYITDTAAIFIKSSITTQTTIFLKKAQTPSLQTKPATEIKSTSANLHGYVVNDGGIQLSQVGFYFGTDPARMDKRICDKVSMDYSLQVQGLSDNTMYYFKAFAVNETGEGTGELLSFETSELNKPIVETLPATGITGYTATLNGQILDNGSSDIVSCGFYYGLSTEDMQKVLIGDNNTSELHWTLNNLVEGTCYYFCSFANNTQGESKGATLFFKTLIYSLPTIGKLEIKNISPTQACCSATIMYNGGLDIIDYGFYFGEDPYTTQRISVDKLKDGQFDYTIMHLKPSTKYYIKAFATNIKGEAYSDILEFVTNAPSIPVINNIQVTKIEYTVAQLNAQIETNGGSQILNYGFYYGKGQNEMEKIIVGEGDITNYSYVLNDLSENTKYYYCAYATNSIGETKSEIQSFKTADDPYDGHTYIDFGLPSGTKWAVMNIGATSPEETGIYFAWGETNGKAKYSSSTYFDRYYQASWAGGLNENVTLPVSFDAAYQNWGYKWSIPTSEQVDELINNCKWQLIESQGVKGFLISKNDKSIFLPVSGYMDNEEIKNASKCFYWTSTRYYIENTRAYCIENKDIGWENRYYGMPIRAVTK